ncbi:MAG: hypothetical protein ILA52_02245, partial [Alphaproteobacteria bacterium]|nr:hypothetical protein [Alphaproteobacteria bacterium]
NTFIVGIGVNIKQSPQDSAMLYPVISLQEAGITTTAPDLLDVFLDCFSHNLRLLEQQDFAQIRQTWLDNTCKLGQKITVRQENTEKKGIFKGIDENVSLLLETEDGIEKILVGDIFYIESAK